MKTFINTFVGVATYYFLMAFAIGSMTWPETMYNGIGIDELERIAHLVMTACFAAIGSQISLFEN